MKCPEEIIEYMHEYLDDEISAEHQQELRKHLHDCIDCQTHFHELKKAIALVQSTSHIQAPLNFTADVMGRLPKENRKVGIQRWFRHHPLLTAASLFLGLMMGGVVSAWNEEDQQFSVSKQPNLIVESDTVIVPKGEVVEGDVTVKNGNVKIEGEVKGDVTVINGENYLASAGHVSGEIKEVNEMFDWIWYHIKKTAKEAVNVFDGEDKKPLEESG
ncbi:anti-sigma factor family protein [Bacillus canaveralius]|uniref:anti-sigma factor family protein n=1 Tax=Bacillus canaveralius TaxID=1403243 RepID=UPI000F767EC1|nr:anti-sigma factor [Bacillus canaveralius]RSK44978.1 anti-sigma factor [Bacillus canaveralius]